VLSHCKSCTTFFDLRELQQSKTDQNSLETVEDRFGLIFGLSIGLIVGLIVGLNRGGSAVVKHYALRLILWLNGYTPFKFIDFLDHCARLILLKKVGGGYIFIHRMLLEYFAELLPAQSSATATVTQDGEKSLRSRSTS
jgi:hypothetical protein